MTGFVGLQAFSFLLTLCRHFQNLKQAYSDVLVGYVMFWVLFLCVLQALRKSSGSLGRES